MKCNVGKTDKTIRLVVALIGLILGFTVSPWYFLITLICAVTAGVSFCPLYRVLGINTCHKEKTEPEAADASPESDTESESKPEESEEEAQDENIEGSDGQTAETEEEK